MYGVIGCSNTRQSVEGYLQLSENPLLVNTAEGGWPISRWADRVGHWDRYPNLRPAEGYDGLWMQLCEHIAHGLSRRDVRKILNAVWRFDPGIPVWLSPLNTYTNEDCWRSGGNTITGQGVDLIARVTRNQAIDPGPVLGPLEAEHVTKDNCHLTGPGRLLVGSQLVEFFDAGS